MECSKTIRLFKSAFVSNMVLMFLAMVGSATGADLFQVKEKGVLRHLGVPYANFVTGTGTGLDA
ncbi:MAG: hypothetical protein JSU72_00855 [Deltaproteobacteria bacterium]|nr:MAG: hypothetical protein JSU72_00855 [Deltaproteobacteria bacterium]